MVNTISCLFWFGFGSMRTILLVLDLENGPNLNAFSSALFGLVWFVFGSMCRILRVVDLENGPNSNDFSLALFRKFGLVWFGFYVQNSLRGWFGEWPQYIQPFPLVLQPPSFPMWYEGLQVCFRLKVSILLFYFFARLYVWLQFPYAWFQLQRPFKKKGFQHSLHRVVWVSFQQQCMEHGGLHKFSKSMSAFIHRFAMG